MNFIPVAEPLLSGNEKKYLLECIETGWVSSEGPFVFRFEEQFAASINREHGILVTNGSDALELAVKALGIGPGDEVIMPAFTIISCAAAIVRAGATPVLVDCEPETWNIDVPAIEARITANTKAIMAVHIYGLPVDMDPVLDLARTHDLRIIEDAAEAIGLFYRGRPCGGFGDISTFSFYANKHVTTGEGGMVATSDPELAKRCRWYRDLCFGDDRFVHEDLGWNMRVSNFQAAVGVAQLENLEATIQRKQKMGRRYSKLLEGLQGVQLPPDTANESRNVYWVYGLVLNDEAPFDAKEAMRCLFEMKIGTRPFFWPMHEQPWLRERGLFEEDSHPVSERIARRGFYIPSGVALTDLQMDQVVEALFKLMA